MTTKEKTKRGHQIADNIRKVLLNVDLRLVYADGEMKLALNDFKLFSRLQSTKKDARKSLRAKARYECYKIYIKNVKQIKAEVLFGVDEVLSNYSPRHKEIWKLYFLEKASIDEICKLVCYSRESVNKIVQKLKLDLCDYYKGGIENGLGEEV